MSLALPSNRSVIRSRYVYFAVLLVRLSIPLVYRTAQPYTSTIWQAATAHGQPRKLITTSKQSFTDAHLFPRHWRPQEDTGHPAYAKLATVGREITTKVKPKAVVIFSAHWQDGPNKIKINVAEQTDLIYDF